MGDLKTEDRLWSMDVPTADVIERLPEKILDMNEVKQCVLFDIDGKPTLFNSLLQRDNSTKIFVFVRHFLDYVTREYVEDFAKIFPHTLQEKNVKIMILGCAPAKYIRQFMEDTSCPHAIFCDSQRTIHRHLGFYTIPQERPKAQSPHIKTNSFVGFWQTIWRAISTQTDQGDPFQMGGQLILDGDGKVLFFHRERHALDHTAINDLLAVAGLPRIDFCTKFRIQNV